MVSVGDALAREAMPIVFVEDFIGSGQQAISILEAWLDVEPSTRLGEKRTALGKSAQEQLRSRRLGFVFACGDRAGEARLNACCQQLNLDASVLVLDDSPPKAFTEPLSERETHLRDFCKEVGGALLLDPDSGHDEPWVRERLLGYGNEAYLVLFTYNTPAQTLTCLWKDGSFGDLPWMALFPRRKKR